MISVILIQGKRCCNKIIIPFSGSILFFEKVGTTEMEMLDCGKKGVEILF